MRGDPASVGVGQGSTKKIARRMPRPHRGRATRLRSSFRDWGAEETDHRREGIEASASHVAPRNLNGTALHLEHRLRTDQDQTCAGRPASAAVLAADLTLAGVPACDLVISTLPGTSDSRARNRLSPVTLFEFLAASARARIVSARPTEEFFGVLLNVVD